MRSIHRILCKSAGLAMAIGLASSMAVPAATNSSNVTNSYYNGSWQQAYLNILYTEYAWEDAEQLSYALIYVDEDEIPELLVNTNVEAGGNQVYTFHNGVISKLQTSRLGYSYIDKGNLFENCDGIDGVYYDYFYSIQGDTWMLVDGVSYDPDLMQETQYMPKAEMEWRLMTGKTSSVTHRYELIIEDCTWWEAKSRCEARGGYLATLTTPEEFGKVTEAILANGRTGYKFYVGASNPRSDTQWGYYWHDPLGEFSMTNETFFRYWLAGEPSYDGEDANHNWIDEDCVVLIYMKDGDYFCLNDVAYDLPGQAPYYKGAIGYICEYDNLPAKR